MAKKFVIRVTPYWLFVLGRLIGEIKIGLTQSTTYYEPIKECLSTLSVYQNTKQLEFNTKNFDFIGKEAERLISDFSEKYSQEGACLDSKDSESLKLTVTRWQERLQQISKNWLLTYPDTHIDAAKLTECPKAFLSDDELSVLSPLEEQSLREAASSLLLSNFTSAEFMALRTAESLLKKWYEKKTDKKLGRTTWGQVLDKLNEEFPKMERPKELHLLDYLREKRNEIAHPEVVSNSLAASTTLLNVISLCKNLHLQKD